MVAGHLSVKNGNYYAVLNYKNAEGKRKTKWISLGPVSYTHLDVYKRQS